jgi:hypothetical protein
MGKQNNRKPHIPCVKWNCGPVGADPSAKPICLVPPLLQQAPRLPRSVEHRAIIFFSIVGRVDRVDVTFSCARTPFL